MMDGCSDNCPTKMNLIRSELAHRGDTEIWLTASVNKLRKDSVKPKLVVKRDKGNKDGFYETGL